MATRGPGRRLRTAGAAVAVVLLTAACGSSSEPETAEEASALPPTTRDVAAPPASPAPTAPTEAPTADGWVRYDDLSGVSLEHPADWEARPGTAGPVFLFLDPPSGVPFRRNVNIMLQTGPSMTLDEYTRLSIDQLDGIEGSSRSEVEPIRLSGAPGQRVEYRADLGSGDLRFLAAWTMRDGNAWLITYSSDPERFEDGKADVERVLRSIRLPD